MSINPRPLNTKELAYSFLRNTLDLNEEDADAASFEILSPEYILESGDFHQTLTSHTNRSELYKTNQLRKILREKILSELINEKRLVNDDEITLGVGGAAPSKISDGKQAIILIGPPASGKSYIATKIAENIGAYILGAAD